VELFKELLILVVWEADFQSVASGARGSATAGGVAFFHGSGGVIVVLSDSGSWLSGRAALAGRRDGRENLVFCLVRRPRPGSGAEKVLKPLQSRAVEQRDVITDVVERGGKPVGGPLPGGRPAVPAGSGDPEEMIH